ncbi:MAG: Fur family transcriptional regulator [Gemmatales bacterium]
MLTPVQVGQSPEEKFREFLASRPTPQRYTAAQRDLIGYIFKQHQHFDAEELCAAASREGLQASRATIYRTLTKLVEAGLLRRVPLGERVVYDHDYGYPQHAHLHCTKCNSMIEVTSNDLENLVPVLANHKQFHPTSYNLVVRGLCHDCNRARTMKRRLDLI